MKKETLKVTLLILLFVASILLAIGLVTPIITLKKFVFVQNTFSIVSGTWDLLKDGHFFLFFIIALFSILLPIFKLFFLCVIILTNNSESNFSKKIFRLIHDYGRWSMLDVFVVAVLIVAVKLGAIADVEKHIGLYFYAASAVLIMYLTNKVAKFNNNL